MATFYSDATWKMYDENGDIFDGDRKVGVATESNEAISTQ